MPFHSNHSRHKFLKNFLLVCICWTLFVLIDLTKKGFNFDRQEFYLFYYLPGIVIWILLTLPAYSLFKKTENWSLWRRIPFIIFFGLIVGLGKTILAWLVFYFALVESSYVSFLGTVALFFYAEATIIAWVMLIVFVVIELYQKYRDKSLQAAHLESQLANAQLQTLKMQIHPHFIFNVHNTIAMMIRAGQKDQAIDMLLGVSELLRTTLYKRNDQMVSLREEMEVIEKYLSLEQIRFEDNIEIKVSPYQSFENIRVPYLIMQPIVENAFKHGISKNVGKSELSIDCKCDNHHFILNVFNTGPPLAEGFSIEKSKGIGLRNTLLRLEKLYNDNFALLLSNNCGGVRVTVKIPIQ